MRIRYGWELALAALLVIEIVAFGAINPRMLDLNMLLFSTSDFICIGIVALPLTMVIVSGGIDISFGSTIGLCAIALGVLFQSGVPMPLAILLTLLLGALCGLINAGLIIYTKVNPLVITFQSDHPVAMMKAVQAVVHHNETADRAYELYLSEKQ